MRAAGLSQDPAGARRSAVMSDMAGDSQGGWIIQIAPPAPIIISAPSTMPASTVAMTPGAGATGTDTLVFRVTTPSGTSSDATVTLRYSDPTCPQPTSYCVSQPNSSGTSAAIGWSGSTRLLDDDFTLSVFGGQLLVDDVDFWQSPATTEGDLIFAYVDAQRSLKSTQI